MTFFKLRGVVRIPLPPSPKSTTVFGITKFRKLSVKNICGICRQTIYFFGTLNIKIFNRVVIFLPESTGSSGGHAWARRRRRWAPWSWRGGSRAPRGRSAPSAPPSSTACCSCPVASSPHHHSKRKKTVLFIKDYIDKQRSNLWLRQADTYIAHYSSMSVFFSKYFLKFKTKLNSRYPVFGIQFQSSRIFVAYSTVLLLLKF